MTVDSIRFCCIILIRIQLSLFLFGVLFYLRLPFTWNNRLLSYYKIRLLTRILIGLNLFIILIIPWIWDLDHLIFIDYFFLHITFFRRISLFDSLYYTLISDREKRVKVQLKLLALFFDVFPRRRWIGIWIQYFTYKSLLGLGS